MFFLVQSYSLFAQTVANIDGLRFIIENGEAKVGRQDKELSGDIIIPSSIEVGEQTYSVTGFVEPTNLTSWSNNTVTTEGGSFQSCLISSVTIPSSISLISAGAFSGCSNLEKVVLPDNLQGIGAASFSNCTSLEEIDIPESVVSFSSGSQYGIVSYTFGGCSKLKTIHIPHGVKTLVDGCFKGAGLDSLFIPNTIERLDDECLPTGLRVLKMEIADLSKLSYSQICFGSNSMSNTDLYVPKGSLSLYQEYEPWANFKSIQEYGVDGETFIPDQISITYEGIRYILKDGVATISRQSPSLSGNIIIPEKVVYNDVNYTVTGMVPPTNLTCYSDNTITCVGGAFQNTSIESIEIPSSITTITAGAFQNCYSLTKVMLPSTMKMLSAACFAGCINLEEINIPDGLTDLASYTVYGYRSYVFGGCTKLKSFVVPSGVEELASGCFLYSGIEAITIPEGCTSLKPGCLNASNLKSVTLYVRDLNSLSYTESCFGSVSNAVLRVPLGSKQVYQEFYPWMDFASIEEFDDGKGEFIPNNIVKRIDSIRYIFYDNNAIVGRQNKDLAGEIVIPDTVVLNGKGYVVNGFVEPTDLIAWSSNRVTTENGAFQSCPITSITIPTTIKVIPAGAFYGCSNLSHIDLPEGLTQIGSACFANCERLEEIKIPESVSTFGSYTRYGFKSYIFGSCVSLKKINIPNGIDGFTSGCFKGSGLETFIIPSNIKLLEEDCFDMSSLKGIKITHTNLDELTYTESVFSNVSNVYLYVPEGTSDLYSQFYPWKNFKEIIEYQDQNDEFNFNAYGVTYTIPTIQSNRANTRASLSSTNDSETVYSKNYVASGIMIDRIKDPELEGYDFKGWDNIPYIMPSHDIIIQAKFEVSSNVKEITQESETIKEVITIGGMKIENNNQIIPQGINIIKMENGEIKKMLSK